MKAATSDTLVDKVASRLGRRVQMVAASSIRYHDASGRKAALNAGEPADQLPDEVYEQAEAAGQITDAKSFEEAQQKQVKQFREDEQPRTWQMGRQIASPSRSGNGD